MTKLRAQLDRGQVAASGSTVTGSVRIQPGSTDADAQRHIALCLDTSGSMSGEKIERVREGVRWVFGYLAEDDYLSIVAFDDDAEVVLPATRWGALALDEAEGVVERLRAGGGTDILAGLEAAYATLADLPTGPDVGRRILLLSDGRDETPTEEFAAFARRVRREDAIAIPAAGIGKFYDEATVRAVATASDAEWVHLSRAADIENFFGRKVETLRTVVAPSPNLEIGLPEGATIGDLYLRRPRDAALRGRRAVHAGRRDAEHGRRVDGRRRRGGLRGRPRGRDGRRGHGGGGQTRRDDGPEGRRRRRPRPRRDAPPGSDRRGPRRPGDARSGRRRRDGRGRGRIGPG
ncbi:hypothetical protein BRC60_04750 [Halobacteriales archaeon QH_1_68_42]|nr:MAG: hypothetical protein BRC60_04750 [Halobacteriales archaeon QH_1_68_42]